MSESTYDPKKELLAKIAADKEELEENLNHDDVDNKADVNNGRKSDSHSETKGDDSDDDDDMEDSQDSQEERRHKKDDEADDDDDEGDESDSGSDEGDDDNDDHDSELRRKVEAGGGLKGLASAFARVFNSDNNKKGSLKSQTSESKESDLKESTEKSSKSKANNKILQSQEKELADQRRRDNERRRIERELRGPKTLKAKGIHDDLKTNTGSKSNTDKNKNNHDDITKLNPSLTRQGALQLAKEKQLRSLACRGIVRLVNEVHRAQKRQGIITSRSAGGSKKGSKVKKNRTTRTEFRRKKREDAENVENAGTSKA